VPVGAAFALEPADWVFPALRESAVLLVRGLPLKRLVAQAFGSAGDAQHGRQMPSSMSARAVNVASGSTSVGTQLPQCVGVAWAAKKKAARIVALGFVGEGGTSTPDFHSAMNFAAVFRVPAVIVCQNNQLALSTPAVKQTASVTFAAKAKAYGMPGVRVDGNDVLAVHRAVTEARVRAVAGGGPTLLECVTRRESPRTESSDVEAALVETPPPIDAQGPIERFRRHLEYLGCLDAELDARMRDAIDAEIADAIRTTEAEPPPARSTLFDDVYAERPWHLVEQAEERRG